MRPQFLIARLPVFLLWLALLAAASAATLSSARQRNGPPRT